MTYRLEGLYLGGLLEVVQSILHVVYCHAAIDAIETTVGNLRYALVGPIPCFEVPSGM